jgi:2-methylcitrate dehydratase PrpD
MACEREDATSSLAEFIVKTAFKDLPAGVIKKTKQLILDTLGSALGGYLTDQGGISIGIVKSLGGNPESTVIASGAKTSCVNAAFANAKMANALDCDEVFYNGAHFASPTIAAALALGEREKASGKDVLTAIALGYDATARVGISSIRPKEALSSFSWHAVGSIVASAKLLGLDQDETLNALGIGCANAPVTCLRKSWPETMVKYGDMGVMAYQGILSALLAQMGHTGSKDILEGENGFWRFIGAERCDNTILLNQLGEKWYVLDSSIKPYPACRWIHPALDLFIKMVKENELRLEEIDTVVVRVHPRAAELGNVYEPKDWLSAQISIPYTIALVAFEVPRSSEWQSPLWYNNPAILRFHRKVEVEEDPDIARILSSPEQPPYGFKRGSTSVEIVTKSRTFKMRTEYAKGDPWVPETEMTDEEVNDKFRCFASRIAESSLRWHKRIEEIIKKTRKMERMSDIGQLMVLLSP